MAANRTRVVLRVRPTEPFPVEQFQIHPDNKTVTLVYGRTSSSGLPSDKAGPPQQYTFKFDSVLHNASQEEVFEACASDAVASVLDGVDATIMCYGQTGAGKTFTMSGDRRQFAARGLIPRAISAVLAGLRSRPGLVCWRLAASYLEVYNEGLYDLLALSTAPGELGLCEDAGSGATQVAGLRQVTVTNEAEALALFFEGESNRVIGAHQLNRDSSRSHTLFSLHLTLTPGGSDGVELASRLVLVDLAGSERVSKTRSEGATALREAGAINRSLHVLEQVVGAAAKRRRPDHIPYRSSRLTHVLRDSLGGNARTLLVANVWGDAGQLGESLSTCRFAARMARLAPDVTRNVTRGGEAGPRLRALEREVAELKEELAMSDLMAAFSQQQQQQQVDGLCSSSSNDAVAAAAAAAAAARQPPSDAQRAQLRHLVLTWLLREEGAGPSQQPGRLLAPLPLTNVRQLRELLLTYKAIVKQCVQQQQQQQQQQAQKLCAGGGTSSSSSTTTTTTGAAAHPASRRPIAAAAGLPGSPISAWQRGGSVGVGDCEQHCSSSAAPDDARPAGYGGDDAAAADERPSTSAAGALPASGQQDTPRSSISGCSTPLLVAHRPGGGGEPSTSGASGACGERDAALAAYLAGPGAPHASLLNDNASKLRAARRRARELGGRLNELVGALEGLKARQAGLQQQRLAGGPGVAEVLGPEELGVLQQIGGTKAAYRDAAAELALARSEAAYTQGLRDTCAAQLEAHFQAWAQAQAQAQQQQQQQHAPGVPGVGTSGSGSRAGSATGSLLAPAHGAGAGRRRAPPPPLASLLSGLCSDGADGADGADGEAAAYAAALQAAATISSGSCCGGGSRASARLLKQHRHERGTFSLAGRSHINDVL